MNEYKEECFKRFENTQKYKNYNTDELIDEIFDLQQELDQCKNNWEELKEYLNNGINYWEEQEKEWIEQGFMKFGGEANTKIIYQGILNKMKELEEKSND